MVSKKYIKYRDKKYAFAFDTEKKFSGLTTTELQNISRKDRYGKDYGGLDTIQELEKYCKKKKCVYQLINKKNVKLYFDFDKKDFNGGECSEEQLTTIINTIISSVKTLFNVEIDTTDFIVETDKKIGKYQSIHIIIDNFMCNVYENKLLSKYLIDNGINNDNCVYSKYRQFRLLGMKKIYKTDEDILVSHNVYGIDKSFGDRIITNTDNCKLIKMVDTYKEDLIDITIKEIKNDKIDIMKNGEEKYMDNIDSECIYTLLSDLNNKFYDNSFYWCNISKLIIRDLNCENNDTKKIVLSDWFRISSEKSNGKYSEDDNKEYFKSINKKELESIGNWSINTFIKVMNKYLSYNLTKKKNVITYEMIEYMIDNTNLSKYEIITTINDTNLDEEKYIEFNELTYWDIQQQYLVVNNEMYNYNEIEYKKRINDLDYEIEYDITITDINEMKIYNKMLVDKTIDILIYKAKWGTGKSHYGLSPVIKNMLEDNEDCKIVIITENNSLNSEVLSKYKKYGFVSHTENNWEDSNKLIISVESSIYIDRYDWDLVVWDESETILNQYESEETLSNVKVEDITKDKLIYHNYLNMVKIIKSCSRVLVMDADISKNRIDWISEMTDKKMYSVYIDINNFSDYTINQYINNDKFNKDLYEDFKLKKKLLFSSSSKKTINQYYRTLQELNKVDNDMKILSITGEGAEIDIRVKSETGEYFSMIYQDSNGNNMTSDKLKELVKKNIEKFVIDNEIDILLYTPSIKTGISMNELYFHKHYSYGRSGSVNCRTYNQMLFRARNLIDKSFNVFISGGFRLNRYVNIDRMGEVFSNISSNYNSDNYKNGLFNVNETDKEYMKMDNHYFNLRMNNKVEDFNSNLNFNSDFITKMKLIHKLNHKYILDDTNNEDMDNLLSLSNSMIKKERLELLVRTELITRNEYETIKEKVEHNKMNKNSKMDITKNEWNKKFKYEMLFGYLDLNEIDSRDKRYYFKQLTDYYDIHNESKLWNRLDCLCLEIRSEMIDNGYDTEWDKMRNLLDKKMCIYNRYNENEVLDNIDSSEYRKTTRKQLGLKDCEYIDIIEYLYNNRVVKSTDYDNDSNYEKVNDCLYLDKVNNVIRVVYDNGDLFDSVYIKDIYDSCYLEWLGKYNEMKCVYDLINTEDFYELWDCRNTKDKYYNANRVMNDKVELTENGYNEIEEEQKENELIVKKNIKYNINIGYIKTLLDTLEIVDIRKTYKYNHKEFRQLINNKLDKLIELDNDYSSNLTELNEKTIEKNDYRKNMISYMGTTDKNEKKEILKKIMKNYKNIIYYLNEWLGKINIKIKCLDKNVNSDSGKLKISFNENHKFNTELEIDNIVKQLSNEECIDINEVNKIKKGYKDENKKSIYKYETTKYEESNDNYSIGWDWKNKTNTNEKELILNIDFEYDNIGSNEVFRRYKKKHSKHLIKKKDNQTKDIIDFNYEEKETIDWYRYNNCVDSYTTERDMNSSRIEQYNNPLKEELMKNFLDRNSPVIVKNECIMGLKDCCLIDDD